MSRCRLLRCPGRAAKYLRLLCDPGHAARDGRRPPPQRRQLATPPALADLSARTLAKSPAPIANSSRCGPGQTLPWAGE